MPKKIGRVHMEDSKGVRQIMLPNYRESMLIADKDFNEGDYICMVYGRIIDMKCAVEELMSVDIYNDDYDISNNSKGVRFGEFVKNNTFRISSDKCLFIESDLCLGQYSREGYIYSNCKIHHYADDYYCLRATEFIKQGQEITLNKGLFYWKYHVYGSIPNSDMRAKLLCAYPSLSETFDDLDNLFSL